MKSFNINRFKRLVCWTYRHDRHEFIHQFLSFLLGITLCFVFLRMGVGRSNGNFTVFAITIFMCIIIDGIVTASNMNYSMKTLDDWRGYMMLPASNLEKFLTRYLSSLLTAITLLLAFPLADAAQYLTSLIYDSGNAQSAIAYAINNGNLSSFMKYQQAHCVVLSFLAFHSIYLLGANFFRSYKYSWVFTSIVVFTLFILFAIWMEKHYNGHVSIDTNNSTWIGTVSSIVIIIICYWLSFRLFCRRQLIAKYINH